MMKKIRTLPFGYIISDGNVVVESKEAEIVQYIFNAYIKGMSYYNISEAVTKLNVPYRENAPGWNKCMIKRVLENPKYTGGYDLPQIIDIKVYGEVQDLIESKTSNVKTYDAANSIKKKCKCHCGGTFQRRARKNNNYKWQCENTECKMNLDIFDKDIEASVTIIFNRVINNIGLIDKHFTKFESYTPTIEITKLNNEINRMLEKRDSNSDEIKKSIFKCASLKYDWQLIVGSPLSRKNSNQALKHRLHTILIK
jgi:hypothetical protein